MASNKDIKRFAFRLNRQLVKAEKAYQSKIYNELKRQQKEIIKNDGKFESNMDLILVEMYEGFGVDIFQTQIEALGTTFKKERFWLESWRGWIREFVSKDIKRTIVNMDDWTTERYNEIKKQIQQTVIESGLSIPNSEFEKRLFEKTGNGIFSKSRARTIARTESAKVANESKRQSAETWESETGVELYKEWIHRGAKDPRTGHERLDGVMIPKDEKFQVISESGQVEYIDYPLAPEVSAENSINCGCQVVYVSKNYAERMGAERTKPTETVEPQKPREVEAPQGEVIEDLPPSTEQTIRDDIKDVFEQGDINISSIRFNKELSIEDKNILKNQVNKLLSEYKIDGNNSMSDKVGLSFNSTKQYMGQVESTAEKVIRINFGHINAESAIESSIVGFRRDGVNLSLGEFSRIDKANRKLGTLTHEFAHVITDTWRNEGKSFFSQLKVIRDEYISESRNLLDAKNKDGLNNIFLGKYASTNIEEFMAEGFKEYKLRSNPSPYALRIGKLIDKHFKK